MMITYHGQTFNCEKELALSIIGGKWKIMIIWELLQTDTLRLSQLERAIPHVHQRTLIKQLKELEQDGILTRTIHPVMPPQVDYELTYLGRTLEKVVYEVYNWGEYLYQYY